MTYCLTRWAIGRQPEIPLSDVEYLALEQAREQLSVALALEEKFELLLANYREFEEDLLRLSLNHMLNGDVTWSGMVGDRLHLVRRISNLLSTARLYTDQVNHDLKARFGRQCASDFKAACSHEYDSSFSYRLLEALRDYLQHRSNPITGIGYPSRWLGEEPNCWMRSGLSLALDIEAVASDKKVNAAFAEELKKTQPETVDLIFCVREYVEAFARIHAKVRTNIAPDVGRADDLYVDAVERWMQAGGENTIGLTAVEKTGRDTGKACYSVNPKVFDRRKALEKRNHNFGRLSRWYVSGVATTADKGIEPKKG